MFAPLLMLTTTSELHLGQAGPHDHRQTGHREGSKMQFGCSGKHIFPNWHFQVFHTTRWACIAKRISAGTNKFRNTEKPMKYRPFWEVRRSTYATLLAWRPTWRCCKPLRGYMCPFRPGVKTENCGRFIGKISWGLFTLVDSRRYSNQPSSKCTSKRS